jgi:hypothetical protein
VCEKHDYPKLQLYNGPVEIERKFLVANDDWRRSAARSVSIRDGLIAGYQGRKVRVRISGEMSLRSRSRDLGPVLRVRSLNMRSR